MKKVRVPLFWRNPEQDVQLGFARVTPQIFGSVSKRKRNAKEGHVYNCCLAAKRGLIVPGRSRWPRNRFPPCKRNSYLKKAKALKLLCCRNTGQRFHPCSLFCFSRTVYDLTRNTRCQRMENEIVFFKLLGRRHNSQCSESSSSHVLHCIPLQTFLWSLEWSYAPSVVLRDALKYTDEVSNH